MSRRNRRITRQIEGLSYDNVQDIARFWPLQNLIPMERFDNCGEMIQYFRRTGPSTWERVASDPRAVSRLKVSVRRSINDFRRHYKELKLFELKFPLYMTFSFCDDEPEYEVNNKKYKLLGLTQKIDVCRGNLNEGNFDYVAAENLQTRTDRVKRLVDCCLTIGKTKHYIRRVVNVYGDFLDCVERYGEMTMTHPEAVRVAWFREAVRNLNIEPFTRLNDRDLAEKIDNLRVSVEHTRAPLAHDLHYVTTNFT